MTMPAPRYRREGWPWQPVAPVAVSAQDALNEAQARTYTTALDVAELTEALRLALQRLHEARADAHVLAVGAAVRAADLAIANARRSGD